eukprot:1636583-Amphidinium_carterae.2
MFNMLSWIFQEPSAIVSRLHAANTSSMFGGSMHVIVAYVESSYSQKDHLEPRDDLFEESPRHMIYPKYESALLHSCVRAC